VKTGQLILVVVSKAGQVADETPKSLQKDIEADDTKKIEEMISDKPKRAKTNSNSNAAKKTADTTAGHNREYPVDRQKRIRRNPTRRGRIRIRKISVPALAIKARAIRRPVRPMKPQSSPKPPATRPKLQLETVFLQLNLEHRRYLNG
jgi:hypothetical protein